MTFEQLMDFVENRMSMSHIYQPLVIRTLLEADGSATLRQLALALVSASEPSLREAEDAIKGFPVRVLRKHGVIDYDTKTRLMTLRAGTLDYQQNARLRAVCEQRLGEFLDRAHPPATRRLLPRGDAALRRARRRHHAVEHAAGRGSSRVACCFGALRSARARGEVDERRRSGPVAA